MKSNFHEEKSINSSFDLDILLYLFKFSKPYMLYFSMSFILLILTTAINLSRPYFIKIIIDDYLVTDNHIIITEAISSIIKLSIIFLSIYFIGLLFSYAQIFLLKYAAQKQIFDMRKSLFNHVLNQSIAFFDDTPVGRLSTRITNDMKNINEMYTDVFIESLKDTLLVVGTIIAMFLMDKKLTLICLSIAPVIYIITIIFRQQARNIQRTLKVKIAKINATIFETISGIQIIQIFNKQKNNEEAFNAINNDHLKSSLTEVNIYGLFRPSIHLIHDFTIALIIYYGASKALNHEIHLGVLFAFIRYIDQLFVPIFNLSDKFGVLQGAMASAERVYLLFHTDTAIPECDNPQSLDNFQGNIEFKNVWFAYNDDNWVLKNVSFHIKAGQTAAFVGATGSGKSTIISLLNRFYDIQKGQILIDEKDIKSIKISELRKNIGIVLQDVFLFAGSIKRNIDLGDSSIDIEHLHNNFKNSQALDFINILPNQYEHIVTERGGNFSSGERQLLSLARALARNPKVLIFDEATSHIDTKTEAMIQKTIENASSHRTSIIVAHRLSTIVNANIIFLIDDGILCESGTHKKLLALNGKYASLYNVQKQSSPNLTPKF